jgi:hypothetical protein
MRDRLWALSNSAVLAAGYSAVGKTTFAAGVEGLTCLSKRRL